MSQKSNHCAPRNGISIIVLAISNTQVLDLTYGDGKHQYQYALAVGTLAPSDTCEAAAMSSTVYRRGWKHLLLYWVSSTLFMTERTAKWQMTSERHRCKNSAANRGGDFFLPLLFQSGSVTQKKRTGTFSVTVFPSWWRTWRYRGELPKKSESIKRPGRRSLVFPVLTKRQEGIKEDNIWWRDKSGDHGKVMQWRTLSVWSLS